MFFEVRIPNPTRFLLTGLDSPNMSTFIRKKLSQKGGRCQVVKKKPKTRQSSLFKVSGDYLCPAIHLEICISANLSLNMPYSMSPWSHLQREEEACLHVKGSIELRVHVNWLFSLHVQQCVSFLSFNHVGHLTLKHSLTPSIMQLHARLIYKRSSKIFLRSFSL